jgi:hypothetical protein
VVAQPVASTMGATCRGIFHHRQNALQADA